MFPRLCRNGARSDASAWRHRPDRQSRLAQPKIRKAIEAEGAELRFLSRYSPDLNPIEMAFSKLKTLLASERSVEALWTRIGELLSHFPQMNVKTTSERQD